MASTHGFRIADATAYQRSIRCAWCGSIVADDSIAMIDDDRYCHGDERVTCYMLASTAHLRGG